MKVAGYWVPLWLVSVTFPKLKTHTQTLLELRDTHIREGNLKTWADGERSIYSSYHKSEGHPCSTAIVHWERCRQQGLTWLCGTSALPYRCRPSLSSQPTASHYSKRYSTETRPLPSALTEPHLGKLSAGSIHWGLGGTVRWFQFQINTAGAAMQAIIGCKLPSCFSC